MALGQIVPFEIEIAVSGSTSPEDGQITFTAGWNTDTTNNSDFGYDETQGVICAFIDTGDGAHNDPGGDATVTSYTWTVVGDEIQGTFNIEGLDDGDTVVVEVWLVLDSSIPAGSQGNVQSRLISAETIAATPESINTGNQTVPLLRVQEFFTSDVDLAVAKSDDPDPVERSAQLTYTIVVLNNGPSVANDVVVTDTLDTNTTFVSATADNGGTCSETGGTVTCELGAIVSGVDNQVTITIVVDVSATAPTTGTGGDGPCDGSEDLCNNVSVTTISDETNPANNSDDEPTDVSAPTAVFLLSFTAAGAKKVIVLNWETATELDNLGYNLYRAESIHGERTRVNEILLPTNVPPGTNEGALYEYLDDGNLRKKRTYYYWLEDVDLYGVTTRHGPVTAQVR
jgi:uncharacterized repeat protein (TIGR01451 family)